MINVTNKVKCYNYDVRSGPTEEILLVESHSNAEGFVLLTLGTTTVNISVQDLLTAIKNATNFNREFDA
jgi:dimeric dUTPase (all-alpha-NTP-PPase superfamily)